MWTASVVGQSPRELREGAIGFEVSPDGAHIAFTPAVALGYIRELWVMSNQGENPQKVLALGDNEFFNGVDWSPDGQTLAYIRVQRVGDDYLTSLETSDLKGASRTVVVPGPRPWLESFCWLPDGRIVYSRQESLDSDNLWQVGVDGRARTPTGKSKRITQWAGSYLLGLSASADGKRLALQKTTYEEQVYLGELTAGGTGMNPPWRLTNDEAIDWPTAWTPDSKTVLFYSNRNGTCGIFKQAIGQETAEPVVMGPQAAVLPRLSADGAGILYLAPSNEGPGRLMRIPVNGGVPQLVLETRNWQDHECASAPSSLCVVAEERQDQKQLTLTAFDPLKGRGKVLRTIQQDPNVQYDAMGLSPDGTMFAVSYWGEAEIDIRLLSLSGGSDREITVKGWPNLTSLDWSPDGKGFYCGTASPQSQTLLYVDLKGNASALWQYKVTGGRIWGVPSPDGRYLAIRGEVTNSNVWMLEGF
jgi:Tol biopolymer transport system component